MEAPATGTNQEFSFADLHLHQTAGFQPSDPIFDPRWENIYIPPDNTNPFPWMGYRQPEDALSSASSSSDGSYAHSSVYSASSDQLNPLNYTLPPSTYQQQPYSNDQFAHNTQTNTALSLMDGDPQGAWAHSHQQLMHPQNDAAAHSSYQSPATGGDPYHYHQQRNSGDYESYESYSSGGEDQQPTHPALSPSPHHHPQQSQHPQPHQMYMQFDQSAGGGNGASAGPGAAGGASPYATSHTKAPELYASPSPVGTAYTNPTTSDGRIRPGSSGGAYPASYGSHSSQGVAAVQGGTRLTPVLEQFERLHYTTNPLSPSGPAPQQQQLPPSNSNNSAAGAGYGSPPGPNRNTRMMPASQSTSGGGSLPYGRPRPAHHAGGGHHSSHHRYGVGHQHNVSNGSSALSSASSQQSQPSPQQQQPATAFPPSGMGKIFAPNPILPPIGNSMEQHQQQSAQHPPVKPKKEMVAGTPTHPDIPRPAIVAPPVPVPHLTKKSRGRQVPSVNSMSNAGNTTSVTSSHSSSRERRHDGRADRERSYDGGLESPLSPHAPSGGYFPGTQWSDSEYEDGNPVAGPAAHAQRSLFGQPPVPMDSYGGNTQNSGPGSTSTASSPATSSSRRTVEDAGPNTSGGPGTLAAGSLEAELRSRPFVCTVEGCGKAYIRAEHLKRHVRSIHTNDKPFECPHPGCGREFSRYDNLCQHFKGVHGSTSTLRNQQHQ